MSDEAEAFAAGDLVADGTFRIRSKLGSGSMGEVYAADAADDPAQRVAIKFMRAKLTRDEKLLRRFRREAEIAQRLESEFVVPFVSAGVSRSGRLWLAFELLEGPTLATALDAATAPALRCHANDVRWIVDHMLGGLCAVHAAGIVHRDVKPSNVLIETQSGQRRARLLDFGVSKFREQLLDPSRSSLTELGTPLGTIEFTAPEQIANAAGADARADIYSVGVVAFLIMTGRLPFSSRVARRWSAGAWKQLVPPLTLQEATHQAWPAELEDFIARSIAIRVDDRFSSAAVALDAWRGAIRGIESLVIPDAPAEGYPDASTCTSA